MSRIELDNVSKSYNHVRAVADVTLAIEPGQFVTLLGPSGSGKTTTMRMIAGLERPDTGSILIGDRTVSAEGVFVPTYRRRLGMVFQSYAVWPHKTVRDNVAFPLQQRGVSREEQRQRVERILQKVGLGAHGERYPSQLSGGQQQRVSLARALVAEPDVILFDEPLSNLDAQLRDSMRELILDLHKSMGVTSVYVTHDQSEAMVLSDKVVVMNQGRLVQIGTPEDLYERPVSRFVANFIGQTNALKVSEIDRAAGKVRIEDGATLRITSLARELVENVLLIRPHQLRFASQGEQENVIPVTVRSASYLGDRVRYLVCTDAGSLLHIDHVATGTRAAAGEHVKVILPPDACLVI